MFHYRHQSDATKKNRSFFSNTNIRKSLLADCDHDHTYKMLLDTDEATVEDDLLDIVLDHVHQRNRWDNDQRQLNRAL